MVGFIKRKWRSLISRMFLDATLVEGFLKGTEYPFKCLFLDNSSYSKWLVARIFGEAISVSRKSRVWKPLLRSRILSSKDSFDLCIAVLPAEAGEKYNDLYDFKCTRYVKQIIDTEDSWDVIRSRFKKRTRQMSNVIQKKYGLGYRVSNSLEEFDHFYYNMFLPHVKKRYGDVAIIDSYDSLKGIFLRGGIIFVVKDGVDVTGALFTVEDGVLDFHRSGVLDASESYIKESAQFALYYFQILYAKEHDLNAVNTRGSFPFLNDGVYLHKRGWGAAVFPSYGGDEVYYFNARPSERMARFFEFNPLIADTEEGLIGVTGMVDETDVSSERVGRFIRQNQATGLSGFAIVSRVGVLDVA